MKNMEKALMRWLHPVVFGIWTLFLIYLVASQRYIAFLRPEFGFLLAIAHFIAMGFILAAIIRPTESKMDASAILRALVLLAPVFFFVIMPDAMLGNEAVQKEIHWS
jgi:hypothetical protein